MRMLLMGSLAVALFACGGTRQGECRGDGDCRGSEDCQLPDPPGVCGIPCNQERLCESSADCGAGLACVEHVGTCCFAGELSSSCRPVCDATSCPEGERCNADGACEVVPCNDGGSCEPHTRCTDAAIGPRNDGCVRLGCGSDGDCDEGGFCVRGSCWDEPGTCQEPMLVP